MTGLHPNTIRLYEEIGFLTKPRRQPNGYRIYTELHVKQVQLIRLALRAEVLQNGLRKQAVAIIKRCAECRFSEAEREAQTYLEMIDRETGFAWQAIRSVETILRNREPANVPPQTRSQVASLLGISVDTLRNWELNGLLTVRRMQNGYRVYDAHDLQRLSIIRTLRTANYSLSSILRLMNSLSNAKSPGVAETLDTPCENEEIVSVCDHLLASLRAVRADAEEICQQIPALEKLATLH
jgi:DNA-binding transcriptional MerR regulator